MFPFSGQLPNWQKRGEKRISVCVYICWCALSLFFAFFPVSIYLSIDTLSHFLTLCVCVCTQNVNGGASRVDWDGYPCQNTFETHPRALPSVHVTENNKNTRQSIWRVEEERGDSFCV